MTEEPEIAPAKRPRWWRILRIALPVLLLGPLLLILIFRFVPVPGTPLMLIRAIQGQGLAKEWVPLDRIAPALAHAVIAAEDNLFCQQTFGFDIAALSEQIERLSEGEAARGASTITMQTAKNLFLWPGRDFVRKGIEAWLTPQLALLWPKRRVIEVYLNIVEFGPGIYGAAAAAKAFFDKTPDALSRHEAGLLASVLPSPLTWSAARPGPYVRERAGIIARRIDQLGPLLDCVR